MAETELVNKVTILRSLLWYVVFLLIAVVAAGLITITYLAKPPANFPTGALITIEPGSSAGAVVKQLKSAGVVRSELFLYLWLLTAYDASAVKASQYRFTEPLDVYAVANVITTGDFTSNLRRLTHPEGETVKALAKTVATVIPTISEVEFITLATPYEGYLFPETYLVPPEYTTEQLIDLMRQKHDEFRVSLERLPSSATLSWPEKVVLASIVEREANSPEAMQMVAGILQNRLRIGMPLQADASIEYDLDKPLGELTPADLKRESPYNTYLNPGLPPTPIGNPGPVALSAVHNPTASDYLFYITGNDGNFYYAVTYDEHRRNIARYLR